MIISLRQVIKRALYGTAYHLGYARYLQKRIQKQALVPILSLHRVSPQGNAFWPPLHPTLFEDLIRYLKCRFEIVTLHELAEIKSKKPLLVLSFDDGYYDFIEYAMPLLKKYRIRVNQNIIPSQLLAEAPLWNIALYDFLQAAPNSLIQEIRFEQFNAQHHLKNKLRLGLQISRTLKALNHVERVPYLAKLEKLYQSLEPYPKTRMIQLSEIASVIAEHELGVHSYSHNSMGNESMAYFIDDFSRCKAFFEAHVLPQLDIYAFPNGSYQPEQIHYLQEQGITYILLVDDKYAQNYSPYPRLNIAPESCYEARLQALGLKAKYVSLC